MQIATKYIIDVTEYDPTGYYRSTYKTRAIVIAESASEAIRKAIERTPLKNHSGEQKAEVITSEDFFVMKFRLCRNICFTMEDLKRYKNERN